MFVLILYYSAICSSLNTDRRLELKRTKVRLHCALKTPVKWFYITFKDICLKYLKIKYILQFLYFKNFSVFFLVMSLCFQPGYQLITRLSGFRTVLRWHIHSTDDKKWRIGQTKKPMNVSYNLYWHSGYVTRIFNHPQIQRNGLSAAKNMELYLV
jgi:hypothetical protein